ncbi:hypothetical protein YTPLAS72_02020 [Nitrospira sp.]|nr:hypothetical protein YTPLAS72_02020 [Nitrospira sp.]
MGPFITGSYADRRKTSAFLIAVDRELPVWVESGRLTYVPELFVTAHYIGEPTIRAKREGHEEIAGRRILGKLGS